jgi:hypothetical protein
MFMRTNEMDVAIRAATGATLLALLLAGCAKPAPTPETPPPSAPPTQVAPAIPDAPPAESLPGPDAAPADPAQPAPDAPPPTEPSAAPKPAAAAQPSIDSMSIATPSAKMSVAVDLRYTFDSAALPNQPVTLHLAAVPRVPGANLNVSVKQVEGVALSAGPPNFQKSGANGADVLRRQYSVTRAANSPSELRVLVTMDMAEGSGFGFFSIPLGTGTTAQKTDSVKQR